MFNFEPVITAAARAAGDKPIVAAPYPLNTVICRDLAGQGLIGGYVSETAPDPVEPDPLIRGWWTDRAAGIWFLRQAASPTMLMLGAATHHELCGGLLLEAGLKGIRRILYVAADGSVIKEVDVTAELVRILHSVVIANPVNRLSYDDLFAEMYHLVGDRLRLPSAAFIPGRVLILIGSLAGGGAERQAAYTAAGLARRFPGEIFVGCCYGGGAAAFYKPFIDAAGVQSCVMSLAAEEYDAPEIVAIRRALAERYASLGAEQLFHLIFHHALLLRELRPEIVHTWLDYSNTSGGIAVDLVGVPRLIMSGRSMAPDNFTIFQPYMSPAYRAVLARRNAVLLNNSSAGARDYARWLDLPEDRFQVIPNGFELPQVAPAARAATRDALSIPHEAVVVGSVSRFSEEKRPMLWLEMAKLLHRTNPQLCFVIYGGGVLLPACRAAAEAEGLAGVVQMPGETSEAWAALSAMDVFVLTSRMEGLPNVMIEAQLMGIPVVCTGTGGMYETFVEGETGFGVPEGTPEALASVVSRLVQDAALRRRMGESARQYAQQAFGVERMIRQTIDAYRAAGRCIRPDWREEALRPVVRLGGIVNAGGPRFAADLPADADLSQQTLWEDDHPLERAPDRTSLAGGRYRLSGSRVYFSSVDGSDPRFNGRTYSLRTRGLEFDEIPIDSGTIQAEAGHCYVVSPGLGEGSAHFRLWENGKRLGPGACRHEEIRLHGGGRYSVWGEDLYFSTSDGSDPRVNGRCYLLRREKLTVVTPDEPVGSDISVHNAIRRLLAGVQPRADFVPGRVVHIGGSLGPGGAERQIVYTMTGLSRAQIESAQLLCYYIGTTRTEQYDFYLPAIRAAGVPVRTIRRHFGKRDPNTLPPSLRILGHALPPDLVGDIADLYWEFIELRPEVVHAWLDGNLERAGLAAALAGVPRIVLAGRNMNPTQFSYYLPHMDSAYRELLQLPHVTMTNNSIAGRNDYADWLGVDRDSIPVIYNGIEFPDCRPPDDNRGAVLWEQFSFPPSSFIVGGIFRFAEEKRPKLWIETAAEVARRLPCARFVLFGDGELREEMERLVERNGLQERMTFAGVTAQILDIIAMMDVLLLTSAFEGLPNVVLEAQWVGTPVVATRAGGTPEAVEDGITGWIVDNPAAAALADCLVTLHENPAARLAAQRRGPEFVKQKFGVTRMVEETLRLYGMSAKI